VAAKEHPVDGNAYVPEVINMFLAQALDITLNTGKLKGHLSYLEDRVVPDLFDCCLPETSLRHQAAQSTFRLVVSDYLVDAVTDYTKKGKFLRDSYIKEVFLKNADIWGAVVSLVPYISRAATGLTPGQRAATSQLLKKYIFSSEYATKPIPAKEVCSSLRKIATDILVPMSAAQTAKELPPHWLGKLYKDLGLAAVPKAAPKPAKTQKAVGSKPKRCPNGTRRNKRTGECEPK
jgi:hypothetical protein